MGIASELIIHKFDGSEISVAIGEIEEITFNNKETVFFESFTNNITDNWDIYGSPDPVWVASLFERNGLFDNNGDANYNNGAISKTTYGNLNGYTIEADVYLDITDTSGCWLSASIGMSLDESPSIPSSSESLSRGINFSLGFAGDACWGTDEEYRRQTYLNCSIFDETSNYAHNEAHSIIASEYANGWYTMKIDILSDRYVKFYIDNNLVWISTSKLHPSLMTNKNVVLGMRSANSAGKAYHDWVKVSY